MAARYHEATCYSPEGIARLPAIDASTQPPPFKVWRQQSRIDLGPVDTTIAAPQPRLDVPALSCLLHHVYGITEHREYPGGTIRLRAAPSAGGLYPTELYVAVRDVPGLPDGIHAYCGDSHTLVPCWEGSVFGDLEAITFSHAALADAQVVLIATALFARGTWRYGDRAYRRALLDTGHLMANGDLAAWPFGHEAVPIPDFNDQALADLLLLDVRTEAPLLLAALVPTHERHGFPGPRYQSSVDLDSPSPPAGAWIPGTHAAAMLTTPEPIVGEPDVDEGPPVTTPFNNFEPICPLDAENVHELIRYRRSTRRFSGAMARLEQLRAVLGQMYPRGGPGILRTWVIAHQIEELPQGVYRYDPAVAELALVRGGDARRAAFTAGLQQALLSDCAFALVQTFDLPAWVGACGERTYRHAHLEAGWQGQAASLAAMTVGLGSSGIGGFFDRFVNALLMLDERHAVAYITTFGAPGG